MKCEKKKHQIEVEYKFPKGLMITGLKCPYEKVVETIGGYISHPFFEFYMTMIDVFNEHVPEKGESWKEMSWAYLMDGLAKQFEDMQDDPYRENYFANIGNYAAMLHYHKSESRPGAV